MTAVPKNVYVDKLDNIFNKYNSTYHRTVKIKPIDVTTNTYIDFSVKVIIKLLNLKLVTA